MRKLTALWIALMGSLTGFAIAAQVEQKATWKPKELKLYYLEMRKIKAKNLAPVIETMRKAKAEPGESDQLPL